MGRLEKRTLSLLRSGLGFRYTQVDLFVALLAVEARSTSETRHYLIHLNVIGRIPCLVKIQRKYTAREQRRVRCDTSCERPVSGVSLPDRTIAELTVHTPRGAMEDNMPKFWIGIAAIAIAAALSAAAYAAAPQKSGGGGGGGGAHVSGGGHVGGGAAHTGSGARGAGAAHVSATGGIPFVCSAKRSGQLYAFDSPQRWQPTCDYPQCHNQHGWQQSADKPDRH